MSITLFLNGCIRQSENNNAVDIYTWTVMKIYPIILKRYSFVLSPDQNFQKIYILAQA